MRKFLVYLTGGSLAILAILLPLHLFTSQGYIAKYRGNNKIEKVYQSILHPKKNKAGKFKSGLISTSNIEDEPFYEFSVRTVCKNLNHEFYIWVYPCNDNTEHTCLCLKGATSKEDNKWVEESDELSKKQLADFENSFLNSIDSVTFIREL